MMDSVYLPESEQTIYINDDRVFVFQQDMTYPCFFCGKETYSAYFSTNFSIEVSAEEDKVAACLACYTRHKTMRELAE